MGSSPAGLQQQGHTLGLCATRAGTARSSNPDSDHPSYRGLQHGRLPGRPGHTEEYFWKVRDSGAQCLSGVVPASLCSCAAPECGAASPAEGGQRAQALSHVAPELLPGA